LSLKGSNNFHVFFSGEPAFICLCVKYRYNTLVPSSAAVERFFSLRKDIFRAKWASLSDKNFNMLMFLKGNSHHLASLVLAQEAKMVETAEAAEKDNSKK
jgi:hypothetical protein